MTLPGLDRWITGNYGQDEFPARCPECGARLEEDADGSYCPECGWGREADAR